jgi:hypothetical protein
MGNFDGFLRIEDYDGFLRIEDYTVVLGSLKIGRVILSIMSL